MRRFHSLAENVVFGGRSRERLLLALLGQHYRSIFRRQWALGEPPHFYDHRHNAFALLVGSGHPFTYYRGFYAAELVRPGDSVLDIGCGDGFFTSRFFASRAAHVDAIDVEPEAIAHAVRHNDRPNTDYAVLDAVSDPFPSERYDVVVLDGSLGHFPPDTTRRLLDKVGAAVGAEGVFVGSESLGVEGHDHLQFFELPDLAALLRKHFAHVEVRVVDYVLPAGALRREAFWRCSQDAARLDAAAWQHFFTP